MKYTPLFDPDKPRELPDAVGRIGKSADRFQDYIYSPPIKLAVNVALATSRPLLVSGPPGCGKSSLARDVARRIGSRYYEEVVTSRTRAQDLLWKFDTLRRLSDAQVGGKPGLVADVGRYIEPGVFWRAFDGASAKKYGADPAANPDATHAVVLLDEIDKADPEVPNDMLVPLGALRFDLPELSIEVAAERAPLVVITSNNEREMPNAFLRRCVSLTLELPREQLGKIARAHFPDAKRVPQALIDEILKRFDELTTTAKENQLRPPGTAEFLDAIRACEKLEVSERADVLKDVARITLWKHLESPPAPADAPA